MSHAGWPESIMGTYKVLSARLTEAGIDQPDVVAETVLMALCAHLGGVSVYWPRADTIQLVQRNAAMWAASNAGRSVNEIAREHGLTDRRVQMILTAEHARQIQDRQADLFGN